jgi:hypothetical protein
MEAFEDDQAACCRFLFHPLSIRTDLAQNPEATRTEKDCHRDGCPGRIWEVGSVGAELTCDTCATIINADQERRYTYQIAPDEWLYFWSNRSTHWHSGRQRCPGGFPVYEYNSGAEDPTDAYR